MSAPRLALLAAAAVGALGCGSRRSAPATPPAPVRAAAAPSAPGAPNVWAARAELRRDVDSMVMAPEFRNAHLGILVVNPGTGDTLYSHNAGKLFMPASNEKIITGSVALALLGPDFRFRTTFAARGARRAVRDGVLEGDLVVHGRGDPSVSDAMRGGDAMAPLRAVADSLAARGVRRIEGRLLAGANAFPDADHGEGWAWDDFEAAYSAGVDELFFNEGFGRIVVRAGARPGDPATATTGPARSYPPLLVRAVTVARPDTSAGCTATCAPAGAPRPRRPTARVDRDSASGTLAVTGALFPGDSVVIQRAFDSQRAAYLAALREAMTERGIAVGGRVFADTAAGEDTLFTTWSPPLREIFPPFEKPSQNQIAEILLKTIGLERTGVGSADSGRRVIVSTLLEWGAARDGFIVRDGSGLSRYNYVSPETIVRVLDAARRDTAFRVLYDALPIAGVDGTIRSRMRGTPAQGNVHAKTGTIAQARSLSGYVTTADGQLLLFSVLANNFTVPNRNVEQVQDYIAAHLAGSRYADLRAAAAAAIP